MINSLSIWEKNATNLLTKPPDERNIQANATIILINAINYIIHTMLMRQA